MPIWRLSSPKSGKLDMLSTQCFLVLLQLMGPSLLLFVSSLGALGESQWTVRKAHSVQSRDFQLKGQTESWDTPYLSDNESISFFSLFSSPFSVPLLLPTPPLVFLLSPSSFSQTVGKVDSTPLPNHRLPLLPLPPSRQAIDSCVIFTPFDLAPKCLLFATPIWSYSTTTPPPSSWKTNIWWMRYANLDLLNEIYGPYCTPGFRF